MTSMRETLEAMKTQDNFFELYSSVKGYKAANRKIATAVRKAVRWLEKRPISLTRSEAFSAAWKMVYPVMDTLHDYGAGDSEPIRHVERIIEKALDY
jgi:hypothetical protein